MPIPELDPDSGLLPPGDHVASLEEVKARFATNHRRREIFTGLSSVVDKLVSLGVQTIWVNGSFVTDKQRPDDVDVVYVPPHGADTDLWDLLSFGRRKDLKRFHKVDLWPYPSPQPVPGNPYKRITIKDFFEQKNGIDKGIVSLDLRSPPP